ncbi:MAG: SDR family oxidoreductase [bacterium]
MKKIFLTGGTGFVGSNIAYQLLKLGYKVIFLVREVAGIAADRRLSDTLKVIDPDFDLEKYSYKIVAGDICLPNLGICADERNSLKADKPDSIFHCAGSIMFSEKEANTTWEINVEGTRKIITFASNIGINRIHHISTAYVVGSSEGICIEKIGEYPNNHFNNPYEKTKFQAEIEIAESGLAYSIYRPSIIIGRTIDGSTLSFGGYYGYLFPFWKLRERILQGINDEPKKYLTAGIKLVSASLVLPVAVKYFWKTTLNLIPVDWFAETVIKLSMQSLGSGRVFNLTHPVPLPIKDAIADSLDIIGIQGVQFVDPDVNLKVENKLLSNIQRMIDGGINEYIPYTTQKHAFDDFNVKALLNSSYKPPSQIDRRFLERTLTYAIAHNFKR